MEDSAAKFSVSSAANPPWTWSQPDGWAFLLCALTVQERVMGMSAAEPFFCVVMHHERKWTIEATWPDKSAELVEIFADYFEALSWLGHEASVWVEKRLEFEPVKAAS
jgi:hypothetical protein